MTEKLEKAVERLCNILELKLITDYLYAKEIAKSERRVNQEQLMEDCISPALKKYIKDKDLLKVLNDDF